MDNQLLSKEMSCPHPKPYKKCFSGSVLQTPAFSFRSFHFAFPESFVASVLSLRLKAGRQVGKCADGDTCVSTTEGPRTLQSIFDAGVVV